MNETENSFYSDLWDDETAKIYSEAAFEEGESEVLSSSNFISNAKQFGHTHVTSRRVSLSYTRTVGLQIKIGSTSVTELGLTVWYKSTRIYQNTKHDSLASTM